MTPPDATAAASPSAAFTSPRLERPHDAPLAGVSLALARTTGTDVVLWRVLFVVLTVFGGLGAALYLGCVVAIPREGEEHSLATRLLQGPDRRVSARQVVLLGLVVIATTLAFHNNGGAVVVAGLGVLAYLAWHHRHPSPVPTAATPTAPAAPAEGAQPAAPAAVPAYQAPVWTPPAPRPRSVLTPLTLSLASLVVGVLLLVAAAGSVSVPTEVVLAAALGVVGLGLVASAFFGRARGLVPVALLLALGLSGTVGARPLLDHGVGSRHWVASSGSYRLGAGDATLTVAVPATGAPPGQVSADVTFGHLVVRVPQGVRVVVDARVTNGDVQLGQQDANGRRVHRVFVLGPQGAPQVTVKAHVGIGQVEVRNG